MTNRFTVVCGVLTTMYLLAAGQAAALPFELIAPSAANVNGSGGTAIGFTAFGWIAPTSGSLTEADLNSAVVTATISDPNVGVTPSTNASGSITLTPGTFAGKLANFATTDNTVFLGQLGSGEALGPSWNYAVSFVLPSTSYSGAGVLDATIRIGGDSVAWSSQINFLTTGRRFEALSAQRLSSVPEPGTASCLLIGLAGLGARARFVSARGGAPR